MIPLSTKLFRTECITFTKKTAEINDAGFIGVHCMHIVLTKTNRKTTPKIKFIFVFVLGIKILTFSIQRQ